MEILIGKNVSKKHLEKAELEILKDSEVLQAIISGRVKQLSTKTKGRHSFTDLDSDKGGSLFKNYLIITNTRVIFWARGAINSSIDAFEYCDIKSVEQQKGIIFGSIVLNIYGKTEHFSEANKKEALRAAELIRENIKNSNNRGHKNENSKSSPIEMIEHLASLHKDGIITNEEFAEKKKSLLEKI